MNIARTDLAMSDFEPNSQSGARGRLLETDAPLLPIYITPQQRDPDNQRSCIGGLPAKQNAPRRVGKERMFFSVS